MPTIAYEPNSTAAEWSESAAGARTGDLNRDDLASLVRAKQRQRWQIGDRVHIEALLAEFPALMAAEMIVLDLIMDEVELREQQGEKPDLEEYAQRFPDLALKLMRHFALYRMLNTNPSVPSPALKADADTVGPPPNKRSAPLPPLPERATDLPLPEQVSLVCSHQAECWQQGGRPFLEAYLEQLPGLRDDAEAFLYLVVHEVSLREQHGERARLGEYLKRFPTLEAGLRREIAAGLPLDDGTVSAGDDATTLPPTVKRARPVAGTAATSGITIAGYQVLGELGRGGMGVVYKARQIGLNRLVALKMILAAEHAGADGLARFRIEAEAVARLQHPNIVQIYEIGAQDGRPFFSLEFVDGGNLDDKMGNGLLPPREVARLVEQLSRAMQYAHERRIIHRDLKPANVLLMADGTPKITDFGLAKQLDSKGQTHTGDIMGTPSYMAPEQASGVSDIGPPADIYALGAVLYDMLTGRPPFLGETAMDTLVQVINDEPVPPRRLQPKLPRDLEIICLRCLEKKPHERYASAGALADDLRRFLDDRPIVARPVRAWERGVKWARRRPTAAALAGVLILVALSIVVAGVIAWRNQLEVAERNRKLRREVEEVILRGREAVSARNWQEARVQFTAALNKIGSEAESEADLADVRTLAEGALKEADNHLEAQELRRRFDRARDEALFHGTMFTGLDQFANIEATRTLARRALKVFGVENGTGPVFPVGLEEREKAEIKAGCYELLLMLAEAEVQALPGEPKKLPERIDRALHFLDRAARLGAAPTRALSIRRARYLEMRGDSSAAAAERRRAGLLQPATALDYFLIGDEYYKDNRPKEALAEFEHALRRRPDHFWAQYFTAICYLKLNRFAEAKVSLTACVGQRPDFVWNYLLRGFALGQMKEFTVADQDYAQAVKLLQAHPSPDASYVLLVNRGVMRVQEGKVPAAIADFRQAVALRPKQWNAYTNLAQALEHEKQYEEATRCLDHAIALAPQLAAPYRYRARFRLNRNDAAAALGDFTEAVRLEAPANRRAWAEDEVERARILYSRKQFEEARKASESALEVVPFHPAASLLQAEALLALKKYPEAVRSYENYLQKNPPTVDICRKCALAQMARGDHAGALANFTRALELKPVSSLYASRGWVYLVSDAMRPALADFNEAIRLDPEPGDAYCGRGLARVRLGRLTEAVADAEEALRRGPGNARMFANAAAIFAQAAGQVKGSEARAAERKLRYQDRAMRLIRKALDQLPAAERNDFWRDIIEKDPALEPVRAQAGFRFLRAQYYRPAGGKD